MSESQHGRFGGGQLRRRRYFRWPTIYDWRDGFLVGFACGVLALGIVRLVIG